MTRTTSEICDSHPDAKALPPVWRDFGALKAFSGSAVTVECCDDSTCLKELSRRPGEGRVLVIDGGAAKLTCALLGKAIAMDLARQGWAGVVLHGCVGDSDALSRVPLGIKALGAFPDVARDHGGGQVGGAVMIGDVTVRSGDSVFGDADGVVILPLKST